MLDQNDIQKIGEELGKVIEQNINPQFEELNERVGGLETRVGGLETRVGGLETRVGGLETRMGDLEKTVANLPTKAYMDDKFADLEGAMIVRQRKEDEKVNRLISFLSDNEVLDDRQVAELRQFRVFPEPPKVS